MFAEVHITVDFFLFKLHLISCQRGRQKKNLLQFYDALNNSFDFVETTTALWIITISVVKKKRFNFTSSRRNKMLNWLPLLNMKSSAVVATNKINQMKFIKTHHVNCTHLLYFLMQIIRKKRKERKKEPNTNLHKHLNRRMKRRRRVGWLKPHIFICIRRHFSVCSSPFLLFASRLFLINTVFDDANERSHAVRRKGMLGKKARKTNTRNRLMTCFGILVVNSRKKRNEKKLKIRRRRLRKERKRKKKKQEARAVTKG